MAKLKAATRNALPASKFALPKERTNAKARATQMVAKGKLSSSQAAEIRRKANAVLKGSSSAAGAAY